MFGRSHARSFAPTPLLLATLGAVAFGVLIGDDDEPDVLARLAKISQEARRVVLQEHSASPTTAEPPLDTPTTAAPPLEGRKAKPAVEGRTSAKIVPSTVIRIEAEKEVAKRAKILADDEASEEKQRIKEHHDAQAKMAEMRKARMVAEREVDALVKAQVEAESKALAHAEANVKAANMIAEHSEGKMKADVLVLEATKKKEDLVIAATQAVESENHSHSRSPLQKLRDTLDPEVPTVADELRRILQVTAPPCVNSSTTSSPPHSECTSADTSTHTSASKTTTASPPEAEAPVPVVKVSMTVEGVDYAILSQNTSLLSSFKAAVSKGIADESGVPESAVTLALSAGSVKATATIHIPMGVNVDTLTSKMSTSSTLGASIADSVKALPGIAAVSNGPIGASGIVASKATEAANFVMGVAGANTCPVGLTKLALVTGWMFQRN